MGRDPPYVRNSMRSIARGKMTRGRRAWTSELLESPHETPDKARRVREMFNAIAPRYELVNSLFSAGRDAAWRRRAVDLARVGTSDAVLDVACGTGDFARAFLEAGPRLVVGCDFAHKMLTAATARGDGASKPSPKRQRGVPVPVACAPGSDSRTSPLVRYCEADALSLPFPSEHFSVVSCAFGVRNFGDLDGGLAEMARVLTPGGRAVILEFTRPLSRLLRGALELYTRRLMPLAASLVSQDRSGAYRYLPRSVVSFLDANQMRARLRDRGFVRCSATPLTMGIVTVYVAYRDG